MPRKDQERQATTENLLVNLLMEDQAVLILPLKQQLIMLSGIYNVRFWMKVPRKPRPAVLFDPSLNLDRVLFFK